MLFRALYALFGAAATVTASPVASGYGNHTIGPENGHLVIVGGNLQSDDIWTKIIDLAGGPDSSIVVIPTAGGEPSYNESFASAVTLRDLGANNVVRTLVTDFATVLTQQQTVLHTYDPKVADTDDFVAPLLEADGIFFGGGRQWRLVDAYAGTKAERAFQSVLDRGGVISGSSAGASIQASFLARGDTANNQIMIGDHTVGFGYLKNAAVDQHVLVRNRHFDMLDILKVHPELLGISIDEDTALIVHKNEAEVFGSTYALIYDGKFYSSEGTELKTLPPPEARFYFLKSGDRYDLEAREVIVDENDSTASDQDRSEL